MQRELNVLREELEEKDRLIERLEEENERVNIEFDVSGLNKRGRTHSTPAREVRSVALSPIKSSKREDNSRSRSLSPVRKGKEGPAPRQGDLRHRLVQTERKLDDTKNMLRLKVTTSCQLAIPWGFGYNRSSASLMCCLSYENKGPM
jgi:predicted  nucleic acid-binding Zn-ribbon protein